MPAKKKSLTTGKKKAAPKPAPMDQFDSPIDPGLEEPQAGDVSIDSLGSPDEIHGDTNPLAEPEAASSNPVNDQNPPPLGPKQKYFESPDGRIYVGPAGAVSIPDPQNKNQDIRAQRGPSPQLHRVIPKKEPKEPSSL